MKEKLTMSQEDKNHIEALNKISERYLKVGKKIQLKHLSTDCLKLLKNAEEPCRFLPFFLS